MIQFTNFHLKDLEFAMGVLVHLKLQPCILQFVLGCRYENLTACYCGPLRII